MTPAQRSEVSGIKGAEVSGIKVARAIQLAIVRCAIRLAKVRCAIRLAKAWLDDQISYRKLYEVGVPNWYPTSTVRRVVWNSLELLVRACVCVSVCGGGGNVCDPDCAL